MSARWGQNSDLNHTSALSLVALGTDIDECEGDKEPVCGGAWRCENSPGSYRCILDCQPGFYMAPTGDCIGEGEEGDAGGRAEEGGGHLASPALN